jgi:uncharacterized protein (TIGR02996 family)
MRSFTYTDDKSNKFWNIEVQGRSFTVTFGKVGSKGQTQTKDFADAKAAEKEAGKLIVKKIMKGYQETTPAPLCPQGKSPAPAEKSAPAAEPTAIARTRKGKCARTPAREKTDQPRGEDARTFIHPLDGGYTGFWSIDLDGTSFTVTSGRIGSAGEAQTETFTDEATARRAYDKLVAKKRDGRRNRELIVEELADPACGRIFVRNGQQEQFTHPDGYQAWTRTSDRFWNVARDGATLMLTWGDVAQGAADTAEVQTLAFADEAEARRERDRRIVRKITEGYVEQTQLPVPPKPSSFAPPNDLRRCLVKKGCPPWHVHAQGRLVFFREGEGRTHVRWGGGRGLLERLIAQKKAKGYREVEPTPVRPGPPQSALEAAVEAAPDDLAPLMVYADWLSEQPDPLLRARGELIQVQLALEDASLSAEQRRGLRDREVELLGQYKEGLCGPFADKDANVGFHFQRGWVSQFSIAQDDDEEQLRYARLLRDWPLA